MDINSKEVQDIIKVENLCRSYVTYKRGSGFIESIKSFLKEILYMLMQ